MEYDKKIKEYEKIIYEKLDQNFLKELEQKLVSVKLVIALIKRLRGKDGCPWDQKQTHESLKPFLLEETYEVLEKIDELCDLEKQKQEKNLSENLEKKKLKYNELKKELGDLLLQILLHSEIASEKSSFKLSNLDTNDSDLNEISSQIGFNFLDVCFSLVEKLVERHPHVFEKSMHFKTAEEVKQNWEVLKKKNEKTRTSILDGIPKTLPSLLRANKVGERAESLGFDWDTALPVLQKVKEEILELEEAIKKNDMENCDEELGDVFFTLVSLARKLKIDPEFSHTKAIDKFESRFRKLEALCDERKIDIKNTSLEVLNALWEEVKFLEKSIK
jgi:tetrapyrrole methylase family protein/MazG family protein